jgi:hypothetical protein
MKKHGCIPPVTLVLVHCEPIWCNHSAEIDADWLPDDTIIRSLGPCMVCTSCGLIGADVRPDWRPLINKPRPGSQAVAPTRPGRLRMQTVQAHREPPTRKAVMLIA